MSAYGPQLPPGFKTSHEDEVLSEASSHYRTPVIGPALPPGFRTCTDTCDEEEEQCSRSDGSDASGDRLNNLYGPALPPNVIGPVLPPDFGAASSENQNFIGPVMPPGFNSKGVRDDDSDEDSSDAVIGPSPSEAVGRDYVDDVASEVDRRARKMKSRIDAKDKGDTEQKREAWMTELPDNLGTRIGLGARTFKKHSVDPNADRSGWTDTPAERARKAEEKASKKRTDEPRPAASREPQRDRELSKRLDEYNKEKRPQSLYEMHKKRKKTAEKTTERRAFDRDEDLKIRRVDPKKAKLLANDATFLRSKFAAGETKFL